MGERNGAYLKQAKPHGVRFPCGFVSVKDALLCCSEQIVNFFGQSNDVIKDPHATSFFVSADEILEILCVDLNSGHTSRGQLSVLGVDFLKKGGIIWILRINA